MCVCKICGALGRDTVYNTPMKLLLLEDDPILSDIIEEFLVENGLHVTPFYDGEEALESVFSTPYDILLLDINVPSLNGFEFLSALNAAKLRIPVIYITSLNQISEVKKGFALGAEDYLKKPFDLEELLSRIKRTQKLHAIGHASRVELGTSHMYDPENLCIIGPEAVHPLRNKEAQLLEYLLANQERIVRFEEIIEQVWRFEEAPTHATVRTYIKTLRSYGLEGMIENIKGVGYRFKCV